jgi:hypothetical protein
MWFLLFLRYLPGLSIAEIKEVLPPPMRHGHAEDHIEQPDGTPATYAEEMPTGYRERVVRR